MEHLKLQRHILCIDLKSFYASVECSLLGVDPFKTPLVVADPTRGGGSVVLAVTPYLKALGVPNKVDGVQFFTLRRVGLPSLDLRTDQ